MPISQGSNAAQAVERRRSERFTLDQQTTLAARFGGRIYRCMIEDLSLGGAKLRFLGEAPQKTDIILEHPVAGSIECECVWLSEGVVGVRFKTEARSLELALQLVSVMINPG